MSLILYTCMYIYILYWKSTEAHTPEYIMYMCMHSMNELAPMSCTEANVRVLRMKVCMIS